MSMIAAALAGTATGSAIALVAWHFWIKDWAEKKRK